MGYQANVSQEIHPLLEGAESMLRGVNKHIARPESQSYVLGSGAVHFCHRALSREKNDRKLGNLM